MAEVRGYFSEASSLLASLANDTVFLAEIALVEAVITKTLLEQHTVYIAGNGGSAAAAQHFASEIVGRYKKERRGSPAVSLTADTATITSISNDYGFEYVFSRQLEALARPGDIFIGFSTSGNSANLIRAFGATRTLGIQSISFSGKGGGAAKGLASLEVVIPSDDVPHIQEAHVAAVHSICELLDEHLT